jgi:hypothetical protein
MNNDIIRYFIDTNFEGINSVKETWKELGEKFGTSGESIRAIWNRYRKLRLRSRWQVQTKGGGTAWLESYRNTDDIAEKIDYLKAFEKIVGTSNSFTVNHNQTYDTVTVCHFSDKHIGASGTKDNPYTADIFRSRMQVVFDKLIQNPADKLIITDLGDALDTNGFANQTVRGGHELEVNMTHLEIFETYLQVHKDFLLSLTNYFKDIEYYHVYRSNHDGNFSYFAIRALQIALPQIKIVICEDNFTPLKVKDYTYIITHGKDDRHQSRSLPYQLNPATENYINTYLLSNNLKGKVRFYKGDLHRFGINEAAYFTYINCPSVFGSSNYGEHNFTPVSAGFIIETIDEVVNVKQFNFN